MNKQDETFLLGDCRETLKGVDDGIVQTCITSPPYFGLRDYGTASWEGGDDDCSHLEKVSGMSDKNTLGPKKHLPKTNQANASGKIRYKNQCGKCGAIRIDNQIGLEETPEAFVDGLVDVFREVKRVLRDDGTLWLNLGDSYAAARGGTYQPAETLAGGEKVNRDRCDGYNPSRNAKAIGLKHKDLIGIPWRVAFALQADGWYLRQDIIWNKPNPMPESVTDRCTKSHEYIFLLSKSQKYFYDADAVKEPSLDKESYAGIGKRNAPSEAKVLADPKHSANNWERTTGKTYAMRNKRSVWTVTTRSLKEAHFATYPPALITPCVLAGSRPGDIVLDPFTGAGTTAMVAKENSRRFIGCELNPEYLEIAKNRIANTTPGLGI